MLCGQAIEDPVAVTVLDVDEILAELVVLELVVDVNILLLRELDAGQ